MNAVDLLEKKRFEDMMIFCPSNQLRFESLYDSVHCSKNIIPFVGSGVSAFAYSTWSKCLLDFSSYLNYENKELVLQHISQNDYLDAAQVICDCLGKPTFFTALRRFFAEEKIDNNMLKENAAYYVPRICDGNCVTTNYDRVIEHACMQNSILYDVAGINDTFKLNTYYREQNKRGLIFKIHGDILSNNDKILLSKQAYEKHYAEGSELRKQLSKWLAGRTFLFIGTSLFNDEPIHVLTSIIEEGIINYAIYPCSKSNLETLNNRFESLGIIPIFYDENDHSLLTVLLKRLVT